MSKLVIFDCDGVLVDSEPISIALMRDHCAAVGVTLTDAQAYAAFLGRPVADAHHAVAQAFGHRMPPIDLAAFQADVLAAFEDRLQPVPGIHQAIAALDAQVCVASSSNLDRIRKSLQLTGLAEMFGDSLFSTDMVARGKPHPDVFLHAAQVMGCPVSDCVVIEDSPAGLTAAKAAGMRSIAFCGGGHAGPAGLADRLGQLIPDILIHSMEQLPQAVEQVFGAQPA